MNPPRVYMLLFFIKSIIVLKINVNAYSMQNNMISE